MKISTTNALLIVGIIIAGGATAYFWNQVQVAKKKADVAAQQAEERQKRTARPAGPGPGVAAEQTRSGAA